MRLDSRGQVGPFSLEGLFMIVVVLVVVFVYIASIYTIYQHHLEYRRVEACYRTALELSNSLSSEGVLVHDNMSGLLDGSSLNSFDWGGINSSYGVPGYVMGVEVRDLITNQTWHTPTLEGSNVFSVARPVSVFYGVGDVHEGLLFVRLVK